MNGDILVFLAGGSLFTAFLALWHYRREMSALSEAKHGAETASREQSAFLESIIARAVDGMITIDAYGIVQMFNPACEKIFGYRAPEVVGKNVSLLMPEPHSRDHDAYLRRYRETGAAKIIGVGREVQGRHKDGAKLFLELSVSEIRMGGRPLFYGILRDVSARKSMDEQLQTYMVEMEWLRAEAEKATRLKSEFLAMMSHEIRTPMNGVLGMTELLLETGLRERQEHYARTALSSAYALLDIINDILDFSKIEAGKMTLDPLPMDLRQVAEDVIDLFSLKAGEKGLRLALEYADGAARFVSGDAGRIRQIMANLLSNAIKFTAAGEVKMAVAPEAHPYRAKIKVSVIDSGIGIPKDVQAGLFVKFTQADASTTRKFGGTGLGLAICKQLAAMMEGDVGLDSVEGKGSTFWFTMVLPEADAQSVSAAQTALPAPEKRERLKGLKVLLVEDNPINQEFAEAALHSFGCKTVIADDGSQAVDLVAGGNAYDIILMDCQMPVMDGYAATRRLRDLSREKGAPCVPVIAMTAHAMKGEREKCLAAGMDDYLSKPFLKKELMGVLLRWVSGAPAPREPEASARPAGGEEIDQAALDETRELMEGRYAEIIGKFIANTDAIMARMARVFSGGGLAGDIAMEAHALKSSSRYLGANAVSDAARELEFAARAAAAKGVSVDDVRADFSALEGAWQRARVFYAEEMQKG
ncbi:MAG: PAS domain S-box protein [Alphaproteobacteria bacterium]|nr:PAS domain S-box protein [Alphaproteobacteria bacterium]